jgi:hypothetical protein
VTPVRRRLASLTEVSLLAATVVLSIGMGLAQGWAILGVLALWSLAFCGVCVSRFPLWEKAAVGLLMPCWLIFSPLAAVTSCDSGSSTINGHTYVEPTVCETVSGSSSVTPLLVTLTALASIAIVTRQVLASFWNKPVS